jgi:hypothetical protein
VSGRRPTPQTARSLTSSSRLYKDLEIYGQGLAVETAVQVLNLPKSEEIKPDSLNFPKHSFLFLGQLAPEGGGHTFLHYIGKYLQIYKA